MGFQSGMKGQDVLALLKNGLPIVDSVNKLDPNAELGSMASVVEPGSIKESSFRDLYQPDASMLDQTTGTLAQPELLSSVSSINFLTPADYSGVETAIILVPRTFSQTNIKMIQLFAAYSDGILAGVVAMYINQAAGEQVEFIVGQVVDGVYTIDDSVVTAINDILASDDWCYLGFEVMEGVPMTEEQFATLDKFVKAVAGVPSKVTIYIKKDDWQVFNIKYENILNKPSIPSKSNVSNWGFINGININGETKTTTSGTAYLGNFVQKITLNGNTSTAYSSGTIDLGKISRPKTLYTQSGSSISISPGYYYRKTDILTAFTVSFYEASDSKILNEYFIEFTAHNDGTTITWPDGLKWAEGEIPEIFEGGYVYQVSIVNNLAAYIKFA